MGSREERLFINGSSGALAIILGELGSKHTFGDLGSTAKKLGEKVRD